jgi:ABC-type transport system substrate-binding protein
MKSEDPKERSVDLISESVTVELPRSGKRLADRYKLIAEVGRGGMGVVYRAEDPVLGRDVAVKMIPPDLLKFGAAERFRQEARTLAQLDHPSILPIHDFGEHRGVFFLVMPLVDGRPRSMDCLPQATRRRPRPQLVGRKVELAELQSRLNAALADSVSSTRPDFSDLATDLQEIFPVFSEIEALCVGCGEAGATPAAARKETDATYVFELFARTLTRLADGQPLMVLLENLHSGEVSLEALEYIVHRLGPTRTLVVGTCRPAEAGRNLGLHRFVESFEDDSRFHHLVLAPFDLEETRQLIEQEVASDFIDDEAIRHLGQATEGNPFFIRELVRSLRESNSLWRDANGVWRLRRKSGITLPKTVQQTVKKRLQRLDEKRRRVLTAASVLGRGFEYEDLEALLDGEENLDDLVDDLLEEGLLEEDDRSRGDRLSLASTVVADVLYRELTRRRRRKLHRRHAERLEKRFARRLERIYPDLVYHFAQADVADKTVRYGLELARFSLAAFSPEETLATAHTALELVDEDEIVDGAAVRGELLFLIAQAERLGGHLEEALFEAERALDVLIEVGAPPQAVKVALFLAETAWQGRQGEVALRWVERGLALGRGDDEEPETLRELLILGATLSNLRGEYVWAQRYLEEAGKLTLAPVEPREDSVPEGGTLVAALLPDALLSLDPVKIVRDGVEAVDDRHVVFRLSEPLPIFPALLTQPYTAILKEAPTGGTSPKLLGTGPFVFNYEDTEHIRLCRNPRYWTGSPAKLEQIEFRTALDASGIAAGLRAGEIDLARDLLPAHLEEILRDPRFRSGLVEATKNNVYFAVFNTSGPATSDPALRQTRPETRQTLYQQFEDLLYENHVLVPLFHDVDYRVANQAVQGLELFNTKPYVNYSTVGKSQEQAEQQISWTKPRSPRGDEIHIPIPDQVDTLDPIAGAFSDYVEVFANVFDPLMLEEDARIVPGLAEVFEARHGGREYYVRLREAIHFHDGRRLTVRDVRYSFERILRSPHKDVLFLISPIRGAQDFRQERSQELAGFRILSATEFILELEEPLAFFPALMANRCASIVPEGSREFVSNWRSGCVGTGAFRVVSFAPGERIELERNPEYWRPGYPKSDRLIFHPGITPEKVAEGFHKDRWALAANLRPADRERLYRTPEIMAGYREVPRLSTYYLAFNLKQGPFADIKTRQCFTQAFKTDSVVRETAGRLARPAVGLIPPGLLGHEASPQLELSSAEIPKRLDGLRLRVLAHPRCATRSSLIAATRFPNPDRENFPES